MNSGKLRVAHGSSNPLAARPNTQFHGLVLHPEWCAATLMMTRIAAARSDLSTTQPEQGQRRQYRTIESPQYRSSETPQLGYNSSRDTPRQHDPPLHMCVICVMRVVCFMCFNLGTCHVCVRSMCVIRVICVICVSYVSCVSCVCHVCHMSVSYVSYVSYVCVMCHTCHMCVLFNV